MEWFFLEMMLVVLIDKRKTKWFCCKLVQTKYVLLEAYLTTCHMDTSL